MASRQHHRLLAIIAAAPRWRNSRPAPFKASFRGPGPAGRFPKRPSKSAGRRRNTPADLHHDHRERRTISDSECPAGPLSRDGEPARLRTPDAQRHRRGGTDRGGAGIAHSDRRDCRPGLRRQRRAAGQYRRVGAEAVVSGRPADPHRRPDGPDRRPRRIPAVLAASRQVLRERHAFRARRARWNG